MTRAGKSYRSSTPKEPKEPKREKMKRLENYRVAKAQAKKFVIPGLIAIIASLVFLFVAMYGLKGTKVKRRERPQDMIFNADSVGNAFDKDTLTQQVLAAMQNQASDVFGAKPEEVEFEPQAKEEKKEEPEKA